MKFCCSRRRKCHHWSRFFERVPPLTRFNEAKIIGWKFTHECSLHLSPYDAGKRSPDHCDGTLRPDVAILLNNHPTLTKPPRYQEKPPHDVVHYIVTSGPPSYQRCRLQPQVAQYVKKRFRELSDVGVCSPSDSPWASPLVVVKQSDGYRLVGDYKKLNAQTVADRYPFPNIFDCTDVLEGGKNFF